MADELDLTKELEVNAPSLEPPTLTLEPDLTEENAAAQAQGAAAAAASAAEEAAEDAAEKAREDAAAAAKELEDSMLSPEEKKMVEYALKMAASTISLEGTRMGNL